MAKTFFIYISFFASGIAISFVFPFFWDVIALIILMFLLKKKYPDLGKRYFLTATAGFLLEFLKTIIFLLVIFQNPEKSIFFNNHIYSRTMLVGGEIGIYEKITVYYCSSVKGDIDPFTGTALLNNNGTKYSIGPDGVDNNMTLIYDPTNGTISRGDIIFQRNNK